MSRISLWAMVLFLGVSACVMVEPPRDRARFERGDKILADCIATQCQTLDLDHSNLRDFAVLNDLPHVTVLMVSYTDFSDLNDIAGMTQLTELHVRNSGVQDLTGVTGFPNLKVLHVSELGTAVERAAVMSLNGLEELAVSLHGESDLSFLADLANLKVLTVFSDKVASVAPLAQMKSLEELNFPDQAITDITPILSLPKLRIFNAMDVTDAQDLALKQNGIQQTLVFVEVEIVC